MSGIWNKLWVWGGTQLLGSMLDVRTEVNSPRCREQFFSWFSWVPCQVGNPCCHLVITSPKRKSPLGGLLQL